MPLKNVTPFVEQLKIENILACCGIFGISRLQKRSNPTDFASLGPMNLGEYKAIYGAETPEDFKELNKLQGRETLEEYRERIYRFLKTKTASLKGIKAYIVMILNDGELKNLEEDKILEMGWEILVPRMKNPSGTWITMYIFYLVPKPGAPAPKFESKLNIA